VQITEEITIAFGEDSWTLHEEEADDEHDAEEGITAEMPSASAAPAGACASAEEQGGVRTGRKRAPGRARCDSRATKRSAGASDSSTHGVVVSGEGSASPYARESRLADSESNRSGGRASGSSAVVARRHRSAVVGASASDSDSSKHGAVASCEGSASPRQQRAVVRSVTGFGRAQKE
jgi:hypothetical protein